MDTQTITLLVELAHAGNLVSFASLLGRSAAAAAVPVDIYRGHVRMSYPVAFSCEYPVELTLATLTRRQPEARYMERHFRHTQTFIPLGGKPFIAVLAPPEDADLPDHAAVRAFLFDGSDGFTLHQGTWHEFPFAVVDDTDMVVILSAQTAMICMARTALPERRLVQILIRRTSSRAPALGSACASLTATRILALFCLQLWLFP